MRKIGPILLMIVLIFNLTGCAFGTGTKGKIVISGKGFTEQTILANIYAEYLKANTNLDVVLKKSPGSAQQMQKALEEGKIDMYVEYTGTGFLNVLKKNYKQDMSPEEIYEETKKGYADKYKINWLEPLGFNDTYVLAVRKDTAEKLGLKTVSDLASKSSNLSFGASPAFFNNRDGFHALKKAYGFGFAKTIKVAPDSQYAAVKDGKIDVIAAFSTDPRIQKYHLTLLKDDKHFFPSYYAVPIIRQKTLDVNHGLEDKLSVLAGTITNQKMRELNAKVSINGENPKEVAKKFLKENGLIG